MAASGDETKSLMAASGEETKSPMAASGDETKSLMAASGEETKSPMAASGEQTKSPMAASGDEEAASGEETALGQLRQEATCPLCLNFFEQPMGLSCGHNLCRDCLAQLDTKASCPECRAKVEPGSAYRNWALAKIVCHLKRLRLSEGAHQESSGHQLCQEHGRPLQTFCSREKSLLCPGCLGGHQGHPLLSLSEAAQEYKTLLNSLLEPLRKEGQKLLEQKQAEEKSWQECQEQCAAEKKVVVAWLTEQEEKMEAELRVTLDQFSGEHSRLQQLMAQTERKCRQPDGEFLQDIQDTVDRILWPRDADCGTFVALNSTDFLQTFHYPTRCRNYEVRCVESISPRLKDRLRTLLQKNASVRRIMDNYKVYVRLDSSTAHPRLRCQRSSVTWGSRYQECLDLPERFNREFCVLGCEGFTTGSHWWEVSVLEAANGPVGGRQARWAIGVAKESVRRKENFYLSPQEGIWAVGKTTMGGIVAFSNDCSNLVFPNTLRVRLDYEAEKVEFLNAETEASLYIFRTGPFNGETLRPFFYVGQQGVTLQCE